MTYSPIISPKEVKIMNNIKHLRKNANMTQIQLSQLLETDQSTISKWELGKCLPDVPTLLKLADFFNVSLDFVLGRKNDNEFCKQGNELTEKQKELLPLIQMLNDRQCQRTHDYLTGLLDITTDQQFKWGS